MKRYIIIILIVIGALGIGAYQGYAISRLTSSESPYKDLQANIQILTDQNAKLISENKRLTALSATTTSSLKELQDQMAQINTSLYNVEQSEIELLVDKLKDKNYTGTYNEGYTWYTAAEALGVIGKPAIPYLIKKIDTKDDYERSLVYYALLLSSQAENVKEFAGSDYIKIVDSFDLTSEAENKKEALRWWEKYKDKF